MIREAVLEDQDDIYQLICILENKELDRTYFEQVYATVLHNDYLYVYEDSKILGCITLTIHQYLHHEHKTGEIVELIVLPEARSQQIGKQLIEYVEVKAKELELEEIELCTSTWRKDAHRFYERQGYIMNHYNYIKKL